MLAHSARGQNIILRFFFRQKNDRPMLNFGYMNFHNDRSLESCRQNTRNQKKSTTKQGGLRVNFILYHIYILFLPAAAEIL